MYGICAYLSTFSRFLRLYLEARIQIRIKVKGRIWIRIKVTSRIRVLIKVKGRIRVRMKVMRIHNTVYHSNRYRSGYLILQFVFV
jgi:hypothetical protein